MASSKEFKSSTNWKKEKELEEARKAGTAPALQDDEGNDINPHIPQYIANAPWYLKRQTPSLKHQRPQSQEKSSIKINDWYARGVKQGPAARKWRKGACENCGALTHKTKECCERPRKLGAKFTNQDIQPDEVVLDLELDYDAKRDRWNGYDPDMHGEVIERYNKTEELRNKIKANTLQSKLSSSLSESDAGVAPSGTTKTEDEGDSDDEEGEDATQNDFKDNSLVLQYKDSKTRTTIRNLRIREDVPKYLRNLALDSAYYDPKTRSMRENPYQSASEDQMYKGDNVIRNTGDALDFGQQQHYAWEASEKGQEVHMQASPSQAQLLFQQFQQKKDELKKLQKEAVLKVYGGAEHINSLPKELIYAQTESYLEYGRDGSLLKGLGEGNKGSALSKYEEDIHPGNHHSVWGSYWENGEWGYACCKQVVRNSFCTGAAGKQAKESVLREMRAEMERKALALHESNGKEINEDEDDNTKLTQKKKKTPQEEEKEKQEKLQKAIEQAAKDSVAYVEKDERKRSYNSASGDTYEVTDEQMEAYRLKRIDAQDPMKNYFDKQKQLNNNNNNNNNEYNNNDNNNNDNKNNFVKPSSRKNHKRRKIK